MTTRRDFTLSIEGMNCQHCAQRVKDALEGVAGVTRADVDLEAEVEEHEDEVVTVELEAAWPSDVLATDRAPYSGRPETMEIRLRPFFAHVKELTLVGYYTSEIGATEELQHIHVPGRYDACVPLSEIGRAWA